MKRIILLVLLALSCTQAPYEPIEVGRSQEDQELIDSLEYETERLEHYIGVLKLDRSRLSYLVSCNYEWFLANGIEPPCHGGIAPAETPARFLNSYQVELLLDKSI